MARGNRIRGSRRRTKSGKFAKKGGGKSRSRRR